MFADSKPVVTGGKGGTGSVGLTERLDRSDVSDEVDRDGGEATGLGPGLHLRGTDQPPLAHGENQQHRQNRQGDRGQCRVEQDECDHDQAQPDRIRYQGGADGDEGVEQAGDVGGQPGDQLAGAGAVVPPQ